MLMVLSMFVVMWNVMSQRFLQVVLLHYHLPHFLPLYDLSSSYMKFLLHIFLLLNLPHFYIIYYFPLSLTSSILTLLFLLILLSHLCLLMLLLQELWVLFHLSILISLLQELKVPVHISPFLVWQMTIWISIVLPLPLNLLLLQIPLYLTSLPSAFSIDPLHSHNNPSSHDTFHMFSQQSYDSTSTPIHYTIV